MNQQNRNNGMMSITMSAGHSSRHTNDLYCKKRARYERAKIDLQQTGKAMKGSPARDEIILSTIKECDIYQILNL